MNHYIVSARKYRPSTFKSVVGQNALTTTLKNAISNNKLAHAYLFCGPRGVGKTTCARIFAKTINCFNLTPDFEACNSCESCVAFNENRSYNIHEMDAASNNSVEDIRELIDKVRVPPQIGKYKVYIIDEVHMLSMQAFNSFLKTLEEPPKHAVFILATTEKHKIIPTILSRCQVYDFNRINLHDIVEYLTYVANEEGVKVEQEALNIIAQKADGGMRDALSIFDQTVSYTAGNVTYQAVIDNLNVLDYEYYFKFTDAILRGSVVDCLLILNDILNRGFEAQHIISGIASHFRDLMISKDPRTAMLFEVGPSIKKRYIETAKACSNSLLYQAIAIANECELNYRMSQNKRLLLELAFIRMCQLSSPSSSTDNSWQQPIQQIDNKQTTRTYSSEKEKPQPAEAKEKRQAEKKATPQVDEEEYLLNSVDEDNFTIQDPHSNPPKEREKPIVKQEPATERRARTRKEPKTFSIANHGISITNDADDEEEEKSSTTLATKEGDNKNEYTEAKLVDTWREYANKLQEEKWLKNTMLLYSPKKISDSLFEVTVNTAINKEYLENNRGDILNWLKKELRNDFVEMKVEVSEEIINNKPFTPQEIFQEMISQNPALQKLRDDLGLEIK